MLSKDEVMQRSGKHVAGIKFKMSIYCILSLNNWYVIVCSILNGIVFGLDFTHVPTFLETVCSLFDCERHLILKKW